MHENAIEIQFKLHPSPRSSVSGEPPPLEIAPTSGRLPRVTQILALAIHFQDVLRRGGAKDCSYLARLRGVTRARVSQIMKLIWLAPDIQQEILYLPPTPGGRHPISELSVRGIANCPFWGDQRAEWARLKERLPVG